MRQHLLTWKWRHPAFALVAAAVFAAATVAIGRGAIDRTQQFAAGDDPAQISNRALDRVFNKGVAEREIQAALTRGDSDLAQSFLDLAGQRGVAVAPDLADRVRDARTKSASVSNTVGRFVRGLWTGEPFDTASLAGTAVGDLFVFGDIRDAVREGARYFSGQPTDFWILGLAGLGIGITAATYASWGLAAPTRAGLTLVKAARRAERLNPALAARVAREAAKAEKAGALVDFAGDVATIESKAGTQAALDSLQIAREPEDVSRLARLSAANGGKTRAIIKLLGRSAIMLAITAFNVATWLLWAAAAALGFFASCKAAAERMTLRYLHRRKLRRAQASLRAMALSA